jgi:hypothetical protein
MLISAAVQGLRTACTKAASTNRSLPLAGVRVVEVRFSFFLHSYASSTLNPLRTVRRARSRTICRQYASSLILSHVGVLLNPNPPIEVILADFGADVVRIDRAGNKFNRDQLTRYFLSFVSALTWLIGNGN